MLMYYVYNKYIVVSLQVFLLSVLMSVRRER